MLLAVVPAAGSSLVPALFTADRAVLDAIGVPWWFLVAQLPFAGVVFALDGVLIGAGDAAFMRTATVVSALAGSCPWSGSLTRVRLGLAGIWAGLRPSSGCACCSVYGGCSPAAGPCRGPADLLPTPFRQRAGNLALGSVWGVLGGHRARIRTRPGRRDSPSGCRWRVSTLRMSPPPTSSRDDSAKSDRSCRPARPRCCEDEDAAGPVGPAAA